MNNYKFEKVYPIDGMRNLNLSKSAEQVEKGEILLEKEVCDFLNDRESGSQSDGGKGF